MKQSKYGDDNLIPLFSFSLEHSPLNSTDMVIISKHRELPWWNKKGSLRGYAFRAESESEILDWIQAIRCRRLWSLKLCRHMGYDTLDIVKPNANESEECVNSEVDSINFSNDDNLIHSEEGVASEEEVEAKSLGVDFADMGDDSFEREINSAADVPHTLKSILDQDELRTNMGIDNERFRITIENENRDAVPSELNTPNTL